jgi:hypothetical protein
VAITQSTAKDSDYVVRHSHFREQCAVGNGQLLLAFAAQEAAEAAAAAAEVAAMEYGIILHGRDPETPGRAGFATVRFPRPDLTGYYLDRLDLFEMYPDLAAYAATIHVTPDDSAEQATEEDAGELPPIDLNEQDEIG